MRWYWGVFRVVTGHCWGCRFFGGGRKDGFPGADGSTITQGTDTYQNAATIPIYGANGNTLTEGSITGLRKVDITAIIGGKPNTSGFAIKNPLTFIYNTATPYDWYATQTTNQDNTLWGEGTGKSTYDPCPHGWRVPTDASMTFGDFSTNIFSVSGSNYTVITGRVYLAIAWFSATGCLYFDSGALYNVGYGGYYWSATVSDAYAKGLYFGMGGVYPSSASRRVYGFSIRCVQE